MQEWNPIQYEKFIKSRTIPAKDLISKIEIDPNTIFDLGCGPGNSTKALKDAFVNASVLGGDVSKNMIERAKEKYPGLSFILFDANTDFDSLEIKYDLIFSNACLQWIQDHDSLISKMIHALNDGGVLAVQIPIQQEHPVHKILMKLASSEKWKLRFKYQIHYNNLSKREYYDVLSKYSCDFEIWETIYCHSMPSHESILEWFRAAGMRPYLEQLSEKEKVEFENDVLLKLIEEYPFQKNGEIMFEYPRLFFVAKKG